jgi:hypothetical protein
LSIDDGKLGHREEAEAEAEVRTVQVGIWGAPESGKTTFLAALFLAATQLTKTGGQNPIAVSPLDEPSAEFQRRHPRALASDFHFPDATKEASRPFRWHFTGDLRGTRFAPHRFLRPGRRTPVDFVLKLRDRPGESFGDVTAVGAGGNAGGPTLIDELAACDGLIYLFDPNREAFNADAFDYFHDVLLELNLRVGQQGRLVGGRLPHQVAVCITKFDDDRTFADSKLTGKVRRNPLTGQPTSRPPRPSGTSTRCATSPRAPRATSGTRSPRASSRSGRATTRSPRSGSTTAPRAAAGIRPRTSATRTASR